MYSVEILDSSLSPITQVRVLADISAGNVLKYGDNLSDWGKATIRIGTKDPLFTSFGNILGPFAYHLRITRDGIRVWQGIIVNNPRRNKNYVEVEAVTYLFLLSRNIVTHDAPDGAGSDNYRTFKSGTLAQAVTAIITEAKAGAGASHPIFNLLTIGTIENPNFPKGYVNPQGTDISNLPWTFSNDFQLKFDFKDTFYVLQTLASYANCDFELVYNGTNLTFNFKARIGTDRPELVFDYGVNGAIEDYDSPLYGENMTNEIVGVAADMQNNILKEWKTDSASVSTYGKLQGVAAYIDAKNINALRSKLAEELLLTSQPDTEIHATLNDRAYPLGTYGLGDNVTFKINDHIIQVNKLRRIIGYSVEVNNTGNETIKLSTNPPRNVL